MSELWDRLRSSPRSQAAIVVTLVVGSLAIGTAIQSLRSESLQDELGILNRKPNSPVDSCPGPQGSATYEVCISTINISHAEDNETRSQYYGSRGLYYHYLGRNYLALLDLDKALALSGVSSQTRLINLASRGAIRLDIGNAADAESDYSQAILLSDDASIWGMLYSRGWARIDLGKPAAALSDFNAAITSLKKYEAVIRSRPPPIESVYSAAERRELEASWARSFVRADSQCFASRATAYRTLGQYDKSLADYEAAIRLTPDKPSLYSGRARTEFAMGNWRAGFGDFWIRTKLVWSGK